MPFFFPLTAAPGLLNPRGRARLARLLRPGVVAGLLGAVIIVFAYVRPVVPDQFLVRRCDWATFWRYCLPGSSLEPGEFGDHAFDLPPEEILAGIAFEPGEFGAVPDQQEGGCENDRA